MFQYNEYPFNWRYGIVNGILTKVNSQPTISYRAETEDLQLIIENCCAKKLLTKIRDNYTDTTFKLYQVKNFKKSEKFYYVINGQILNFAVENFILVNIPSIDKSFTLFNFDDLNKLKSMFKSQDLNITIFEKGFIKKDTIIM